MLSALTRVANRRQALGLWRTIAGVFVGVATGIGIACHSTQALEGVVLPLICVSTATNCV
jgi:hypothetical protein